MTKEYKNSAEDYLSLCGRIIEKKVSRTKFIKSKLAQYNDELSRIEEDMDRSIDKKNTIKDLISQMQEYERIAEEALSDLNKLLDVKVIEQAEPTDEEVASIIDAPEEVVENHVFEPYSQEEYDRLLKIRLSNLNAAEEVMNKIIKTYYS